jgi:hypothetical protein
MPSNVHYTFKVRKVIGGEEVFITPWGNPFIYEYPFDHTFDTAEAALAFKEEHAPDEDFVLCRVLLEPVQDVPASTHPQDIERILTNA